jgi:hypothetical protein
MQVTNFNFSGSFEFQLSPSIIQLVSSRRKTQRDVHFAVVVGKARAFKLKHHALVELLHAARRDCRLAACQVHEVVVFDETVDKLDGDIENRGFAAFALCRQAPDVRLLDDAADGDLDLRRLFGAAH